MLYNETDGYFVTAQRIDADGPYYVTEHMAQEADATRFVPDADGRIVIKGLEDDAYLLTEVKTDDGYLLLENHIPIEIAVSEGALCSVCGKALLTASAKVNGSAVTMLEDNGCVNALATLTVINTHSFDLPQTGDNGTMLYTIGGIVLCALAGGCILLILLPKKKKKQQ